jgi:hypothetical protein
MGRRGDTVSFRSKTTDFQTANLSRFAIAGPLVEQISELPNAPFEHEINLGFSFSKVARSSEGALPKAAKVFFTAVRAPNGVDLDGALLSVLMDDGEHRQITITELSTWLVAIGRYSAGSAGRMCW